MKIREMGKWQNDDQPSNFAVPNFQTNPVLDLSDSCWTLKRLASVGIVQRAAGCQEAEYSDDLEEDPFDEDEEVRRFAAKCRCQNWGLIERYLKAWTGTGIADLNVQGVFLCEVEFCFLRCCQLLVGTLEGGSDIRGWCGRSGWAKDRGRSHLLANPLFWWQALMSPVNIVNAMSCYFTKFYLVRWWWGFTREISFRVTGRRDLPLWNALDIFGFILNVWQCVWFICTRFRTILNHDLQRMRWRFIALMSCNQWTAFPKYWYSCIILFL